MHSATVVHDNVHSLIKVSVKADVNFWRTAREKHITKSPLVPPMRRQIQALYIAAIVGVAATAKPIDTPRSPPKSPPRTCVTLTLQSSLSDLYVPPGTPIDWAIYASVPTDSEGLALISTDLIQDEGNPAKIDIPQGDSVPPAMVGFSRPYGVSNPENGYLGSMRGNPGEQNLVQIGGAQNTLGEPGSTIGLDAIVDGGIGQSAPQLILSGQFGAPSTPGAYQFYLANALANVLTSVQTPPHYSPVEAAPICLENALQFTVNPDYLGDCNCDGTRNGLDVQAFVDVLLGTNTNPASRIAADTNNDGYATPEDVPSFMQCLLNGC